MTDILPPVESCADHLCLIFLVYRSNVIVRLSLVHPRIPRHSWSQVPAGQRGCKYLAFSGGVRPPRAIACETTPRDVPIGGSGGIQAAAVVAEARTANGQE